MVLSKNSTMPIPVLFSAGSFLTEFFINTGGKDGTVIQELYLL